MNIFCEDKKLTGKDKAAQPQDRGSGSLLAKTCIGLEETTGKAHFVS